jgi:uncharacterized protein (TIRG00374 family)
MGQRLRLLLQASVSAALIAVLLWRSDLKDAANVVRGANYVYLAMVFPLYLLANLLNAFRWRVELYRMRQPPLMNLFGIYLTGMMANRILPMRLGDVLRVQVLARRYTLPRTSVTAVIFVTETLLDGLAFVVLFLATLAFLGIPQLPLTLAWVLTVVILTGLLLATAAARLELREGWQDRGWYGHLPQIVRRHTASAVPRFLEGLAVLREPTPVVYALGATFAAWLVQVATFYLLGQVFGLNLSLADAVIVTIVAALVVSIPLAPSSLGTYEVAVTGVLVLMGASNAEAVTYAVGSHVLTVAFSLLAGVPAAWLLRIHIRDALYLGLTSEEERVPT